MTLLLKQIAIWSLKHTLPRACSIMFTVLLTFMIAEARPFAKAQIEDPAQEVSGTHEESDSTDVLGLGILLPGDAGFSDTIPGGVPVDGPELVLMAPVDEVKKWEDMERKFTFNPDPVRAVWMSVLFPGLGQIYNRRYWKLPIIVGGFMGLGYGASWNNTMLRDYTRAYADLLDKDPSTKSYMDFFPPTIKESQLDKSWLTNLLRSRRNYFRRNRDLCIIGMVGVYLLAIVDAYVDASLAHFDISPDLSMDVGPAMMQDGRNSLPSLGLLWAVNF